MSSYNPNVSGYNSTRLLPFALIFIGFAILITKSNLHIQTKSNMSEKFDADQNTFLKFDENTSNHADHARSINRNQQNFPTQSALINLRYTQPFQAIEIENTHPLETGMINVSYLEKVSRLSGILTSGTVISIPADINQLPQGYSINDINTYHYNERAQHWQQLQRDSFDIINNLVYSTASEDGDYINAIIQVPDLPETQGYIPTTINDLKVGDPASMIQIIAPPTANTQGTANLSYHIEVPHGRNGVEPNINITYNSEAPDGVLGEGWSFSGLSSITVDTRRGVPLYDSNEETETYMLDGSMLAYSVVEKGKTPNFYPGIKRSAVTNSEATLFLKRREAGFDKIVRIGVSPAKYVWIITKKNGTKYFYGTDDGKNLKEEANLNIVRENKIIGIAEWKLVKVEDRFGNSMHFSYRKEEENGTGIFPTEIEYTKFQGAANRLTYHSLKFFYSKNSREDNSIYNARYGTITNHVQLRLDSILVQRVLDQQANPELIRKYAFSYISGGFKRLLLKRISQHGSDGQIFYKNEFNYYNENQDEPFFAPFKTFSTPKYDLTAGIKDPLHIVTNEPTAIGGSKSSTNGGGMYIGFGPGTDVWSVNNTVGIQYNSNSSNSSALQTLMDIDGDGRPDQVFSKDGAIYYSKNISTQDSVKFESKPVRLSNVPGQFFKESLRSTGWGAKVNFGPVSAGYDHTITESITETFFSDVNGDGFVDFVSNGVVRFNTGKVNKSGQLEFSDLSSKTPLPINGAGAISSSFVYDNAASVELINNNPLQEVVKMWEAPYPGKIKVEGEAKLIPPKTPSDSADGVYISIESKSAWLDTLQINENDFKPHEMKVEELSVTKGDRIFFRIQSGKSDDADGSDDKIEWSPKVRYVEGIHLADTAIKNLQLDRIHYNSTKDFLVSDPTAKALPDDIKEVRLVGTFLKDKTADSVFIEVAELFLDRSRPLLDDKGKIMKNAEDSIVYDYSFNKILKEVAFGPKDVAKEIKIALPKNLDTKDKKYLLNVRSHVNIDLNQVQWQPAFTFDKTIHLQEFTTDISGTSKDSTIQDTIYIVPNYIFNDLIKFDPIVYSKSEFSRDTLVTFKPNVKLSSGIDSSFWFSVKSPSKVLGKKLIKYTAGKTTDSLTVEIPKGEYYLATFEASETPLGKSKSKNYLDVCSKVNRTQYYFKGEEIETYFGKRDSGKAFITQFPISIQSSGNYLIIPDLAVDKDSTIGEVIIQVWKNGARIELGDQDSTIHLRYSRFKYPLNYISVENLKKGDKISVLFIYPNDTLNYNKTLKKEYSLCPAFDAEFLINRDVDDQIFGPLFKSWGQFVYNGMSGRSKQPLNTNLLKLPKGSSASEADIQNFNTEVNNSVNKKSPIENKNPVFDKFSASNIVFSPMLPIAKPNGPIWQGGEDDIYVSKTELSTSRLGIDNVKPVNPYKLNVDVKISADKSYGRGVVKLATSTSDTYNGGASIGSFGLSGTHSNTSTIQVSDFTDLNGDRFPDVLNGESIQFTNSNGQLQSDNKPGLRHQSVSSGSGFAVSGSKGLNEPESAPANSCKCTGAENINTKNALYVNEASSSYIGASGAYNQGDDHVSNTWLDINGDGLPDKVYQGSYELNLGYGEYASSISTNFSQILKSENKVLSPGVTAGFSYDKKSFSGGAGLSFSDSRSEFLLQDMNADGLADIVNVQQDGKVRVDINTGKAFVATGEWTNLARGGTSFNSLGQAASINVGYLPGKIVPEWLNMERTKFNASNGVSFGGSATFGFTAFIIPVKFVFNPSFNHANGLGRTIRQIIDINADGYPDIIYSNAQGSMEALVSLLGKTNKLVKVSNPLGGSFTINYDHVDVTTDNPGGKWVMNELIIDDSVSADRSKTNAKYDSKKQFAYSGGKYDRFEREFLGFASVTTTDLDFDGKPYRDIIVKYDTNYYRAGSIIEEMHQNAQDKELIYTIQRNTYHAYQVGSIAYSVGGFNREVGIMFSPLETSKTGTYEGTKKVLWRNLSSYDYNTKYGYVEKFSYKELNNPDISYQTTIKYQDDAAEYVIGLPVDVLTIGKKGETLRHKGAEYYRWNPENEGSISIGEKYSLKKIFNYLDASRKTTTEYRYGNVHFGIVRSKIMPTGVKIEYTYDSDPEKSATWSYITEVKNASFNFKSLTEYDYRFGLPKFIQDINENKIFYQYDNFGRLVRLIGPKECNKADENFECATASKYTINISYALNGTTAPNLPLTATVTHIDEQYSPGVQTINFIDGFNRSIQIKKTASYSKPDGTFDETAKWIISGRVNFDAFGRPVETYYPGIDRTIDGLTYTSNTASKFVTRFEYDVLDRKVKTILPNRSGSGQTFDSTVYSKDDFYMIATTFSLNDNVTSGGIQKRQVFTDGSGLIGKEVLFDKADTAIATAFSYDPIHQLKQVVDARKTKTEYRYDPSGNRTESIHPDGGKTSFLFDNSGRLDCKLTAVGDSIHYVYKLDRLVRIKYDRHPENNVLYVYGMGSQQQLPGMPNPKLINGENRVIYQEDASGSQAFEYGPLGEITKTTRTIISPFSSKVNTFQTVFRYDTWNRIREITYPDNETLEYKYNRGGLLFSIVGHRDATLELSVDQKDYPYVKEITYDEFEQRNTLTYGNGTKTVYSFEDDRRRLKNLNVSGIKSPSIFLNNFDEDFTYDNQNNMIKNVIGTNTGTSTSFKNSEIFFYDRLNRLDSAHSDWSNANQTATYGLKLGYDGVFNIINKHLALDSKQAGKHANIDYNDQYLYADAANHQLTDLKEEIKRNNDLAYAESNHEKYEYDKNGNNTIKSTGDRSGNENIYSRKIDWDEENRINAVSMSGYVSHYVYDANGERTIKLSTVNDAVYVNGKFVGDTSAPATFSLYANPYFSMRNGNGIYSKHIYIGAQRIISQVENIKAFKVPARSFPEQIGRVVCPYQNCPDSYTIESKRKQLNDRMNADFARLDVNYEFIKDNAFENPDAYQYEKAANPVGEDNIGVEPMPDKNKPVLLNYFYHSNQVGSTSFITDNGAHVVQCISYLPFGETFMELRQNYSSQFLFNGKEQDRETGLYYYGARYYDLHTYQWLGVDPMAEKYAGLSPYVYCINNPVVFADIQGKWASKLDHYVHQAANANAIWMQSENNLVLDLKLNALKVNALNEGTVWADESKHQTGSFSYMHAMTNRNTNQSINEAKKRADNFVREMFNEANFYREAGDFQGAYFYLGAGLHTIQDATSPEHSYFKPWGDNESIMNIFSHIMGEKDYPGLNSPLQRATNKYLNIFENSKQLPQKNIFDDKLFNQECQSMNLN